MHQLLLKFEINDNSCVYQIKAYRAITLTSRKRGSLMPRGFITDVMPTHLIPEIILIGWHVVIM